MSYGKLETMKLPIRKLVIEAICDGEMHKVWSAIKSELDADITIEYVGGPVQIRFGDYISGDFKRRSLTKIVSEIVDGIEKDGNDYELEIAKALIKQGKRILSAIDRMETKH